MIPSEVFPLIAILGLSQAQAKVVADCFRLVEIATKEEAERPMLERRRKDRERKKPVPVAPFGSAEIRGNPRNDAEIVGFPPSRTGAFFIGEVVSLTQSEATLPTALKPAKRNDRGTRLPVDWQPNEGHGHRSAELGISSTRFAQIHEEFRNYWLSEAGQKARKLNWDLTFTNRLIDQSSRGTRNGNGKPTIHDELEKIVVRQCSDDDLFGGNGGEVRQGAGRMLSTRGS